MIGFFATAVAGYLTGMVGASNNPVSGVTIIVLLAIAVILKLLRVDVAIGPHLAIMAGAVVCTAAAMAGDSLHDLATGYHVGATPRSLEIAVLFGAVAVGVRDGAGVESADQRLRNRRHAERALPAARRTASVPDGEGRAGRLHRQSRWE